MSETDCLEDYVFFLSSLMQDIQASRSMLLEISLKPAGVVLVW